VLAAADLPDTLRSLPRASLSFNHTSVVNGNLAATSTSVPFDGGATTRFVGSGLVKQHGFAMQANPQEVCIANGAAIISPGTVQAYLQIQQVY
jgi:hypothetical protein